MDFRSLFFSPSFHTHISANSFEQLECLELRVSSTIEEHFSPGLKNIGDRNELIMEALTGSLPSFITTSGLAKNFQYIRTYRLHMYTVCILYVYCILYIFYLYANTYNVIMW